MSEVPVPVHLNEDGLTALRGQLVDAAVTNAPASFEVEEEGEVKPLAPSKKGSPNSGTLVGGAWSQFKLFTNKPKVSNVQGVGLEMSLMAVQDFASSKVRCF